MEEGLSSPKVEVLLFNRLKIHRRLYPWLTKPSALSCLLKRLNKGKKRRGNLCFPQLDHIFGS